MNLYNLQYFQVVAQENHITRAAQKLNIAQPALSVIISKLEKELGVQLFDRVGRQIILNDCGKILLEYTNNILDNWNTLCIKLDQYREDNQQQIKIASTGILFPQRLIQDFKMEHPDITIKQSNIMVDEILNSLLWQNSDFVISSILVDNDEVEYHFLRDESIYLLANKDHPLVSQEVVSVHDLEGESFISLPEGYAFRQSIDEWFSSNSVKHNVVLECFPSQFSDYVSRGIGLAFASESTVKSGIYPPEVIPVPVFPELKRSLYILWKKTRSFSRTCKIFQKYAINYDM